MRRWKDSLQAGEVIAAEAAGDGETDDTPRSPQAEGWLCREKEAIRACCRICRGDRARLRAREPGRPQRRVGLENGDAVA